MDKLKILPHIFLITPPASSTIIEPAATSQILVYSISNPSNAPQAT